MRRPLLSALFALCAVSSARAQWTERLPLLATLRPAVRAELSEREVAELARLPLYRLTLRLEEDLKRYHLQEVIELENDAGAPLPQVVLRLFGNSGAARGPITVERVSCTPRACSASQPRPDLLELQLTEALPAHGRMQVTLALSGRLPEIAPDRSDPLQQGIEGLMRLTAGEASDYGLLSYGDEIATLAHFYAVLARREGTRWVRAEQQPFGDLGASGLSFVQAELQVPRDVTLAVSGTAVPDAGAGNAQTRVVRVQAPLVRDFGVSASRHWTERSRQLGDVRVRGYALARDADAGKRVLDTAAAALAGFERRFGRYPYRELAVVEGALVGGAGGCELSGLSIVASMLYRPLQLGSLSTDSLLELTTAHEVAHQYWYGLVGSDARAHPFQDEALTQWSALLYFEDRYGPERAAREGESQVAVNYRLLRAFGGADAVVDRPVDAFDSALSYAGIIYGKAPYLYADLRKRLGDAVFFAALRAYTASYRFQEAPSPALFDLLAEQSGRPREVRRLVRHWLAERHGDHDLGLAHGAWLSAAPSNDAAAPVQPTTPPSAALKPTEPPPVNLEQLTRWLQETQQAGEPGDPAVLQGQGIAPAGAGSADWQELQATEPNERGLGR